MKMMWSGRSGIISTNPAENNLIWDRTEFSPEVQNYILAGAPVTIEWELNRIARASFTLARGDLFDPHKFNLHICAGDEKGPHR